MQITCVRLALSNWTLGKGISLEINFRTLFQLGRGKRIIA